MNKNIFFSKDENKKQDFIRSIIVNKDVDTEVIYIYPKNKNKPTLSGIITITYEDVTKTNEWLYINGVLNSKTILILDNPSRYPKITSSKFQFLQRLSMRIKRDRKYIIDIVPFTIDIMYLYSTYTYIDRSILGFAHFYAFRENYKEMTESGEIVYSHNHALLSNKIKDYTDIDYEEFLCKNRKIIRFKETDEEIAEYNNKKESLFDVEKNINRIITRLADTAHAFHSRIDTVVSLADSLDGNTIIYTNLSSYAKNIKKKLANKKIIVTSYQLGSTDKFDNAIYAETSIVKSYFFLDAESRLKEDATTYHILGDTKIDTYLYEKLTNEITQINNFTKELARCKKIL